MARSQLSGATTHVHREETYRSYESHGDSNPSPSIVIHVPRTTGQPFLLRRQTSMTSESSNDSTTTVIGIRSNFTPNVTLVPRKALLQPPSVHLQLTTAVGRMVSSEPETDYPRSTTPSSLQASIPTPIPVSTTDPQQRSRLGLSSLRHSHHHLTTYLAFAPAFAHLSASLSSTTKVRSHRRLRPAIPQIQALVAEHAALQALVARQKEGLELLFFRMAGHADKNEAGVRAGFEGARERLVMEAEMDCREIWQMARGVEECLGEVGRRYGICIRGLRGVNEWVVSVVKGIVMEQGRRGVVRRKCIV